MRQAMLKWKIAGEARVAMPFQVPVTVDWYIHEGMGWTPGNYDGWWARNKQYQEPALVIWNYYKATMKPE